MNLDFSEFVTTVVLSEDQRNMLTIYWNKVFELSISDENYVWEERLEETLARLRALLDDTNDGARLFGETAAHIFHSNSSLLDNEMTIFKGRFRQISADARQAFDDSLGNLGDKFN